MVGNVLGDACGRDDDDAPCAPATCYDRASNPAAAWRIALADRVIWIVALLTAWLGNLTEISHAGLAIVLYGPLAHGSWCPQWLVVVPNVVNGFVDAEVIRIDLDVDDARLAAAFVIGRCECSPPVDVSPSDPGEARRSGFSAVVRSVMKWDLAADVPTFLNYDDDLVASERPLDDLASFDVPRLEEMSLGSDGLLDIPLDVDVVIDDERRYGGSLCGWILRGGPRPPLDHVDDDLAMRLDDLAMAVRCVGRYAHSPLLLDGLCLSPHEVVSSTLLSMDEKDE
ncbi:MAG: hypothetical protein M1823_003217 [Watsoniomyces obsoletus]|nr:MAG: hypothetical protein M1823_003217 [Watsoniomyces obsoletus]